MMWAITQNLLWDAGLHCKKRLAIFPSPAGMSITRFWVAGNHGRMNYKDTKSYMSAFLSVDLLTEFAAFCLTDFIDWRYIQSCWYFRSSFVNCCPLTFSPVQISSLTCVNKYTVHYTYTVCKGGRVWGSGPQTDKHLLQSPFTCEVF